MSQTRKNLYVPVKKMIDKFKQRNITTLEENNKTYNQIDNEIIEALNFSYDEESGQLQIVEGDEATYIHLNFDDNGRLESVHEENKITERAVDWTLLFNDVEGRLIRIEPNVLNEGAQPGYEENNEDIAPEPPDNSTDENVDLDPISEESNGDFDWKDDIKEEENM